MVSPGEGDEQHSQPAHSDCQSVQEDAVDPLHIGHDSQAQFTHNSPDGDEGHQGEGRDVLRQPRATSQVLQEKLRGEATCRKIQVSRSTGGWLGNITGFNGAFGEGNQENEK